MQSQAEQSSPTWYADERATVSGGLCFLRLRVRRVRGATGPSMLTSQSASLSLPQPPAAAADAAVGCFDRFRRRLLCSCSRARQLLRQVLKVGIEVGIRVRVSVGVKVGSASGLGLGLPVELALGLGLGLG